MERIGIAASKIAKGNLFLYNLYVIIISLLVSFLLFLLTWSVIFLVLFLIRLGLGSFLAINPHVWASVIRLSLISLILLVAMICLITITKNFKLKK